MKLNKAMILAAGYGTRLKPLTDSVPKPLIKINGEPMISIVLNKLIRFGIKEVIINTHYLSHHIEDYFTINKFGIGVKLIFEPEILGTGGGIKNAQSYFRNEKDVLIYNVDVLSDIDLNKMYEFHKTENPVSTLAVQNRNTTRPLLIDSKNDICGKKSGGKKFIYQESMKEIKEVGFCGIHIISNECFTFITENGFFDIFTSYFRLIKQGKSIKGFLADDYSWADMGKFTDSYIHSL